MLQEGIHCLFIYTYKTCVSSSVKPWILTGSNNYYFCLMSIGFSYKNPTGPWILYAFKNSTNISYEKWYFNCNLISVITLSFSKKLRIFCRFSLYVNWPWLHLFIAHFFWYLPFTFWILLFCDFLFHVVL